VIRTAEPFAARLGGSLVYVWADGFHVSVQRDPDGAVVTILLGLNGLDGPDRPCTGDGLYDRLLEVL
jgi:hypothetical protein